MSYLHTYFIKQSLNYWRNLSLRVRIEILILLFIYFVFFASRLTGYFNDLLNTSSSTPAGLSSFLLHAVILLLSISIPLIHLYLVPKQKSLSVFRCLPLSGTNSFLLLLIYHFKYQLIGMVVILPVFTALIFSAGILYSAYFLIGVFLYIVIFIAAALYFTSRNNKVLRMIYKYFLAIILFNVIFSIVYVQTNFFVLFDLLLIPVSIMVIFSWWRKNWQNWDRFVEKFPVTTVSSTPVGNQLNYFRLKRFMPQSIYPIFAKEFFNYLRNRRYIRRQIFSLLIFAIALGYLTTNLSDNFEFYTIVLTGIVIWQHYALQFNEKYVKSDSHHFMKTLPFKYLQIWTAKFINEYVYLVFIQIILLFVLLYRGLSFNEMIHIFGLINLFAFVILFMMINFKILFFDQPRMAGYAYHFFVVFTAVMSFNFYLVGPIITLTLMIYFFIKSYREFAK